MVIRMLLTATLLALGVGTAYAAQGQQKAPTCELLDTEVAAAMEQQRAGVPITGYTFGKPGVARVFEAIVQAQQLVGALPPGTDTTHVKAATTETVVVIHYLDRVDVLLLFYGADDCRFAQGTLPVETWEAAMCIGGFRDCRPGTPT